ncbi:acetylcholinesterase-like isoform X2 [Mya arenaria]|uniref:acetylcholinesterase-like isoform X2 n=1 Tax=Mya arenaria TaxID=6604 RepID=UPI0022E084CA|nr:acetylcholinesterase-like isoform X2 [Mya arenaria]
MLFRVLQFHAELLGFVLSLVTISGIAGTDGASSFGPIQQTTKGRVKGLRVSVHGTDVDMYLGIPYAKPPVGNLRFRHPLPADHWSGVLNATEKPNACPQGLDEMFPNADGANVWNANTNRSEDCLYLNVWVPRTEPEGYSYEKHVMVWIFGGGFYSGSSALDIYDGRYIAAENDIIIVSMQYRLGSLGFLTLFHPEAPGNAGLFDQVLALDWVQQNIHFFGGNPHSVTLFGESAGAVSVGMHMLSPLSRGKFHKVILQSGAPHAAWAVLPDKEAKNRSMSLAKLLHCDHHTEIPDIIDCLREKPVDKFVNGEWYTITSGVVRFPFVPVVDGSFLTEAPEKSLITHNFKRCPVLLGHNKHEANYWLLYYEDKFFSLRDEPKISESAFDTLIDLIFFHHPFYPKELNTFGKEAIKFEYRNWVNPHDQRQNAIMLDHAVGDFHFICPTVDFALLATNAGNNVFYYVYEHRSSVHPWPEWMGVLHGDEINFVFGEPENRTKGYTHEEIQFSKKMMRYWTNFAKTGDPNRRPGHVFLDEWPLFTNETREHLILQPDLINRVDKTVSIGRGARAKECSFWRDYLPNLVLKTEMLEELSSESQCPQPSISAASCPAMSPSIYVAAVLVLLVCI